MYFSLNDCNAGWSSRGVNGGADWQYWNNPVDRKSHDGKAFVPWYLEQFRKYEEQNGTRLLDVLDLHAYIDPGGLSFSKRGDAKMEKLRLTSTRVFWDPNYVASWLPDVDDLTSPTYGKPVAPALVPRMKKWVADYYPGTQTALTEYNWGAAESVTGALAQADILGIFGREGLDIGTLWGPTAPTDPLAFAFKMFRNYDGIGGTFGETSIQASSPDPDTLSVFAAERSDRALTVLLINKTTASQVASLNLGGGAQVWSYSEANLKSIVHLDDVTLDSGITVPAYSLTMVVIPADPSMTKPVVESVIDSASRQAGRIAPGQEVVIRGSQFGADAGGTRFLFDGVAAAIVALSDTEATVSVPYFGATKATTHLQVEVQGVRSDAVELNVAATAPALFTADGTGSGQALATGDGSSIVLLGTGEGRTDPGGVDGRPATTIIPRPLAKCEATIGGLPAVVEDCSAVPGMPPGRFQMRVRADPAVAAGDAVAVTVTIGGVSSQANVTIAVR